MAGGLRFDAKELPLPLREQLAVKIVAQIAQANPVAGQVEKRSVRVKVKRLIFPSRADAERYSILKDALREGVISDLRPIMLGNTVTGFVYRLQWSGEFTPTGIPEEDLLWWSTMDAPRLVIERFGEEDQ